MGELSKGDNPAVDLTNCDREAIHLLGAIQPSGFLLAMTPDWRVSQVSANAPDWIGQPVAAIIGGELRGFLTREADHAIRNRLTALRPDGVAERVFNVPLLRADEARRFDIAIHRSGALIVIECEPSEPDETEGRGYSLPAMIARLQRSEGFALLTREAARLMQILTGFDRVMIYKFHPDGSGEVIAEAVRSNMEPFLGLRYPASDVPRQARELYARNWLRIIADVESVPVPLVSGADSDGAPLDLSMSLLRSVSPIHLEYLRNMGVRASMSVSLMQRSGFWGLIVCHHRSPRPLSFDKRTTAELFGHVVALMIETCRFDSVIAKQARTRRLQDEMMGALAAQSPAPIDLLHSVDAMRDLIACDGVGMWVDQKATLTGATPTQEEFLALVRHLQDASPGAVFATDALGTAFPPALDYPQRVAGILAIPLSRTPRDFIVFFRRELARTVRWAGDPSKPVTVGPNGIRLTPRKSFEAWQEIVRGHSNPWSDAELEVANSLRATLMDVVLRLHEANEQERKKADEKQTLLIGELNHRVRNILGLISGLISQGKASATSVTQYAQVLDGRVRALARAHDQITLQSWGPGSVTTLIETEAAAFLIAGTERVRTQGPDVLLMPEAYSTLGLVVHELMTNSAKYGALSDPHGRVDVAWSLDAAACLVIAWREIGGPPVRAPTRRGFGIAIIEGSIPHDLKGETEVSFHLTGLQARLVLPAAYVLPGNARREVPAVAVAPVTARLSGRVLLVEDNMIVALDAEDMLLELGAAQVDVATSVAEALRLLALTVPDIAVLDMNLGKETSLPVVDRLRELGVPVCFATGYGNEIVLPPGHEGIPIISKPYSIDSLGAALARSMGAR